MYNCAGAIRAFAPQGSHGGGKVIWRKAFVSFLSIWLANPLAAKVEGVSNSGSGGGGRTTLATLKLLNDSDRTMNPAGTLAPVFGWVFKKGQIIAGDYPQFVES